MQFYFIRHGQSVNNLLWDSTGTNVGRSFDPELTETGWAQARLVARFLAHTDPNVVLHGRDVQNLAGFGITHLYTSLMVRAVATASAVAEALHIPLVAWPEAHETGGIYRIGDSDTERIGQPGYGRTYFQEKYPGLELPEELSDKGWWNRAYEEEAEVLPRAERFIRDLITRHGGTQDHVALVSHGGFYNALLQVIFRLQQPAWFSMNNVAITRIDFEGGGVDCAYMNQVGFLPKELVT